MTSFRERNPFTVGAVGLSVVAALLLAAFNIDRLPLIGAGNTYRADFADASGLHPGDRVEVAGVRIGEVSDITLHGDHVQVHFQLDGDIEPGTATRAAVKVGSLLGEKYLAVMPAGGGTLDPGTPIPQSRTTPAYDITEAFGDLTKTLDQVDTEALARAMDTMAATFADSPEQIRDSLEGLTRLSATIASRDAKLRELFARTNSIYGVLDQRNEQFTRLLRDAELVLDEIRARRDVIHQLLVNTERFADQLAGMVADNRKQIGPALARVNEVIDVLRRNQASLERGIAGLAPFTRVFTNMIGNGPWFDSYVVGLVPSRPEAEVEGGGGR